MWMHKNAMAINFLLSSATIFICHDGVGKSSSICQVCFLLLRIPSSSCLEQRVPHTLTFDGAVNHPHVWRLVDVMPELESFSSAPVLCLLFPNPKLLDFSTVMMVFELQLRAMIILLDIELVREPGRWTLPGYVAFLPVEFFKLISSDIQHRVVSYQLPYI